jgi:predicted TIM-barrel fold metal-dependent hydrolase
MIVDGHAHACGELLTLDGLLRALDTNGVDRVVLVPGEHASSRSYPLPDLARLLPGREVAGVTNAVTMAVVRLKRAARHLDGDNAMVAEYARVRPDRVVQFFWLTLREGFAADEIAGRLHAWRFSGLKLHQCWDRFEVESPAFGAAADFAAAHALPVFVHLRGPSQATALAKVALAHPQTRFIVAHLIGLERFIAAGRDGGNVYFDISCPDIVSTTRILRAVRHFGADHVLMGSDTPYGRDAMARSVRRVRALGLPSGDERAILCGTAARLLGIDQATAADG